MIKHYAGKFSVWLSPIQIKILPVSDKYLPYAGKVLEVLKAAGVPAEVDTGNEKLGYKIRKAQMDKVPYMGIIGEKEQTGNKVSVRQRDAQSGR